MGVSVEGGSVLDVAYYDSNPADLAEVADAGASSLVSRGDHAHPYDDAGWQATTLQNGWVVYDATYGHANMYRKVNGVVFLRGLIKAGATSTNTVLFSLPVGFKPSIRQLFIIMTAAGAARLDVATNGDVLTSTPAVSASWTSLSGVTFVADG